MRIFFSLIHIYGIAKEAQTRYSCIFHIMAYGIHCSLGGNPPMSHRVNALNSFVLPAHEVDVSYAPLRGQCPNGLIQPDLSRLVLSMCKSPIVCETYLSSFLFNGSFDIT